MNTSSFARLTPSGPLHFIPTVFAGLTILAPGTFPTQAEEHDALKCYDELHAISTEHKLLTRTEAHAAHQRRDNLQTPALWAQDRHLASSPAVLHRNHAGVESSFGLLVGGPILAIGFSAGWLRVA